MTYTIRELTCPDDIAPAVRLFRDAAWELPGRDLAVETGKILPASTGYCAHHQPSHTGTSEIISLAISMPGTFRYQDRPLPMTAVTGVVTATHARRSRAAAALMVKLLQRAVDSGAVLATLGAFDQGYYNRFGFGNGGTDPMLTIDPAALTPRPAPDLTPVRLTPADAPAMHAARTARHQSHGACTLTPPAFTDGIVSACGENSLGLGLRAPGGANLAAHFFATRDPQSPETKLRMQWMCADTPQLFLSLLGTLHALADQIEQITLAPPAHVCLQDLIRRPLRGNYRIADPTEEVHFWQLRILDLKRAISAVSLPHGTAPLRFNLTIHDPLSTVTDGAFAPVSGDYTIELGNGPSGTPSQCTPGHHPSLPLLVAGVGAFSRLWAGILPATVLAVTDTLSAPADLLQRLDETWHPSPSPPVFDWEF